MTDMVYLTEQGIRIMELKNFIKKTRLENEDGYGHRGNKEFDTNDYIFLETFDELELLSDDERKTYPSDYAVMNGALMGKFHQPPLNRKTIWYWLRSVDPNGGVDTVVINGDYYKDDCLYDASGCLRPALNINLSSIVSNRNIIKNLKVKTVKCRENKFIHTIEFGSYPQNKAKNSKELEQLYQTEKLIPTGKTYTGYMKYSRCFEKNPEFEYNGKKYVRVVSKRCDNDAEYKDGTRAPKNGTPMWAEVQPIKWIINNWHELPKFINPKGTGTAETIYVTSQDAIIAGIPFYIDNDDEGYTMTMWQNSPIRAFLNGYDLYEEIDKRNGKEEFKADCNFSFKGKGFLNEAFDSELELVEDKDKELELVL